MSYTKGPWKVIRWNGGHFPTLQVRAEDEYGSHQVCSFPDGWNGLDDQDDIVKANAQLISAAPDMYEALKLARKRLCIACGLCDGEGEKVCGNVAKIDAALAKAEGREVNDG